MYVYKRLKVSFSECFYLLDWYLFYVRIYRKDVFKLGILDENKCVCILLIVVKRLYVEESVFYFFFFVDIFIFGDKYLFFFLVFYI